MVLYRSCVVRLAEGEVDSSDVSIPCLNCCMHGHVGSRLWVRGCLFDLCSQCGTYSSCRCLSLRSWARMRWPAVQIADLSFTLTDAEVANGMVLTCMSRPVSDRVRGPPSPSARCMCTHTHSSLRRPPLPMPCIQG